MLIWPEEEGWPQEIGALAILDGGSLFDADGEFRLEAADLGRTLDPGLESSRGDGQRNARVLLTDTWPFSPGVFPDYDSPPVAASMFLATTAIVWSYSAAGLNSTTSVPGRPTSPVCPGPT